MNVLIVRLGALGDIVHAVPAAAAVRAAHPKARIDWLVDARHRDFLELVTVVDNIIVLERPNIGGWIDVIKRLRPARYDAALDMQGLLKSAVLARASGASKVLGFSIWHLREKTARPFYSESIEAEGGHVVRKNLRLLQGIGIDTDHVSFPIAASPSAAADAVVAEAGGKPIALVNPGAAWPNKRWDPRRFGEVAAFLHDVRGCAPFVLWGPGEQALAQQVVAASGGVARVAPETRLPDLVELCRRASLMIAGDTGPLHIASAVGTPIVSLFGPTDPERNGPWSSSDVVVSRYDTCGCQWERRCHEARWCLNTIDVAEVTAGVQQRLATGSGARG